VSILPTSKKGPGWTNRLAEKSLCSHGGGQVAQRSSRAARPSSPNGARTRLSRHPRRGQRPRPRSTLLVVASATSAQKRADRFLHGRRHRHSQHRTGYLGGPTIRLEERHTIRTLAQMPTETRLFTLGQIALDVVQAVLNELLTADHGPASVSRFDGPAQTRLRKLLPDERNRKEQLPPHRERNVQKRDGVSVDLPQKPTRAAVQRTRLDA
jgi:hypothetical protein